MSKFLRFVILLAVLVAVLQETDARRKILRGRKVVNRTYMRPYGIPGWAIVTLVAISFLVFGGLLYLLLKVTILDKPIQEARYARAPTQPQAQPVYQQQAQAYQQQPQAYQQPSPV